MIQLAASTIPTCDYNHALGPQRQWSDMTRACPLRGRLAFLVFDVECDYFMSDYFVGLHDVPTPTGYLVSGTVDQFQAACRQFKNNSSPHDVLEIYQFIDQKLRDFGYDEP